MKFYELAKRVANFAWDFDPYHAKDCYGDFGEAVSCTMIGLCDTEKRKGILKWFESVIEEGYEPEYAQKLMAEVATL